MSRNSSEEESRKAGNTPFASPVRADGKGSLLAGLRPVVGEWEAQARLEGHAARLLQAGCQRSWACRAGALLPPPLFRGGQLGHSVKSRKGWTYA